MGAAAWVPPLRAARSRGWQGRREPWLPLGVISVAASQSPESSAPTAAPLISPTTPAPLKGRSPAGAARPEQDRQTPLKNTW